MLKILLSDERYGRKTYGYEDDDLIDRLNNRYTVRALIICIFIIVADIQVGKPINCWTPAEFKGQHDGYANSICWLRGSYYLPTDEIAIPDRSQPRTFFVAYYQWTAFILLGMAALFLAPKILWHTFTRRRGLNIQRLVQMIRDNKQAEKGVDFVKTTLKSYLETRNTFQGTICCGIPLHNFYAGYTLMYFTVKVLYVIITLTQFFLLNAFLSFNFTSYGLEGINKIFSGEDWFESPRFPRVTMCDFMVRRLGSNQHWYAVQCTLPINIYNEKIFLAIWIWLIILTILNILSLISWIVALRENRRLATVKKYLRVLHEIPSKKERLSYSRFDSLNGGDKIPQFTHYLHTDGFLIFRIFAHNTDDLVAGKIIGHLYENYHPPTRNPVSDV